jgi:phage terminase small subunit
LRKSSAAIQRREYQIMQRVRAKKPIQQERIRAQKPYRPIKAIKVDERPHKFVLLYFKHPNGTEAARQAGYTGSDNVLASTASQLLRHPKIQAHLGELRAKAQARSEVSVEKLLRELGKIAFASMKDFTRLDGEGNPHPDLSDLSDEDWACIQEVQTETYIEGAGDLAREVKRVKIKLYDKLTAIEKAGKHLGMFDKRRGGDADDEGEPQQRVYSLKIGNANILIQNPGQEANPSPIRETLALSQTSGGLIRAEG